MAHEDIYWEDENNCFDISEWQARYPAQRYAYGVVEKTTYTDYYDEDSGDSWKKTQTWHWSYWVVLDWVYPDEHNNSWTNFTHSLYNSMHRCISGTSRGANPVIEGDLNNPSREQFVTRASTSETTLVQLSATPDVIRSGNEYTFFEDYVYDESELSPPEISKEDQYNCSFEIENNRGDLWSLNESGRLTLDNIHSEVLPDEENPPATEWILSASGRLTMPLMKELINDLGGFNNNPNLEKVVIPSSVMSIGRLSFNNTNLTEVTLPDECTYYSTSFPPGCIIHGGQLIN